MRHFKIVLSAFIFIFFLTLFGNSANAAGLVNADTSSNTVRVGFYVQNGLLNEDEGSYSGYAYDILNRICQYNSWELTYKNLYDYSSDSDVKIYSTDTLNNDEENSVTLQLEDSYPAGAYKALADDYIDLFVSNNKFEEFSRDNPSFIFSEYDIGTSSYMLCVRKDGGPELPDYQYSEWPVLKVGYYEGNPAIDEFAKFANDKKIRYSKIEITPDFEHNAFELNDKIDVFVSSGFRAVDYDLEVPKAYFGENSLYLIAYSSEKSEALMSDINAALTKIRQYEPTCFSDLSKKYFSIDLTDSMLFTREEREYIEANQGKSIYAVAYLHSKPYIYLDEQNHYAGIFPEYIKLVNDITGLNIKIIGKNSVNEYQYSVYSNTYDLCLNERYDFTLANAHGIRLTNPYLSVPVSKISLSGKENNGNNIGVFTIHKGDKLNYVNNFYTEYESAEYFGKVDNLLDSLISHKIDVAYMPYHMMVSYKNTPKYSGLAVETVDNAAIKLCIGVCDEDNLILANILSKASNYISEAQIQDIVSQEMTSYAVTYTISDFVKEHRWIIWTMLWGGVTITIIFIVLTMRTRNAERDKELAEANNQYYKTILSSNLFVIEAVLQDNGQRLYNYYHIEVDEKGEHIIKTEEYDEDFNKFALKIHPEDIDEFKAMFTDESLDKLIKSQKTEYKEIRCKYEDDMFAYLGITVQPLVGDSKRVLLLVKDVSSAKIEEEEKRKTLQVALDTAKSMGDSKNTFLSQISHDLRTPMNAIVGMTALAQINIDDEEKVRECLATISNSSEHLLALLNDILDVTRIESGRFTFNQKRIRIKSVLQNTILMLERKAKETNITLNVDVSSVKHDYIISDENRLEQVFVNILSNAIKYSKRGGVVNVSLKELNNQNVNEFYYDFIVEDNGIGMSEATLEKLFMPFERGQEAIGKEGTGLGMTITKSIVDALGGIISVDSELGVGTKFVVSLSFNDDVSSSLAGIEDIEGKNALIICTDPDMRYLLADIFEEGNMKVYIAQNIEDEVILDNEYAVIAVSLILSLEEEIKILSDIRKKVGRKPIIFDVSYEDSNSTTEIAKANKIDGFVSIPCYKENVTRVILDALESRRMTKKIRIKKNQQGLNALIVEDVEINAIFAQAIAEMKGFKTTIATNGQQAFELLDKSPDGYYSIVFMDIQMPVLNGYDATRLIRKSKRQYLKNIPIIAMSANTFPEDIIKSRNAGMNDHISKPIDLNKFSDITDKYIVK